MPRPAAEPLIFAGPPDLVEGYVPVDPARRREIRVLLDDGAELTAVRVLTAAAGGQTLVRLMLPAAMPAQRVHARVEAGDQRFDAEIRLDRQPQLDCSPAGLDVELAAGVPSAEAVLRLVNLGNVAAEVPRAAAFGLMRVDGLENAIGAGLLPADRTGLDRIAVISDALAEQHGGLARVAVRAGAGTLEPSAAVTVRADLSADVDRLTAGRTYTGVWVLAGLNVPVTVRVGRAPEPPARRGRRPKAGTA